jgi:hypothetical protein
VTRGSTQRDDECAGVGIGTVFRVLVNKLEDGS